MFLLVFLMISYVSAFSQCDGNIPVANDWLKVAVITDVNSAKSSCSILQGILSGTDVLFTFRFDNRFQTYQVYLKRFDRRIAKCGVHL